MMKLIDLWSVQVYLGAVIICVAFIWSQKLPEVLKSFWFYFAACFFKLALVTWGNPLDYPTRQTSAIGLILLLLIPYLSRKVDLKRFCYVLSWIMMFDAIAILFGFPGLFTSFSMDTTVMALIFPMVPWPLSIPMLIVIAVTKSSTATLVLLVNTVAYFIHRTKYYKTGVVALSVLIAIKYQSLKTDSGRLEMWKNAMEWWQINASHWNGVGGGSFEWLGLELPFRPEIHGGPVMALHNDWLQILFEFGYFGSFLSLIIFFWLLIKAEMKLKFMIAGFGVAMCFYSPLHFVVTEFLACLLIWKVIDDSAKGN